MVKFDMEHVLILLIVAFVLYHLMNRCSCFNNGFSVGGSNTQVETGHDHQGWLLKECWKEAHGNEEKCKELADTPWSTIINNPDKYHPSV
tara:strand:+ start:3873 stop:4142 length:270 start_codon:yes stop_codon:yes gene_type:complete